jgi:hypothetical protein
VADRISCKFDFIVSIFGPSMTQLREAIEANKPTGSDDRSNQSKRREFCAVIDERMKHPLQRQGAFDIREAPRSAANTSWSPVNTEDLDLIYHHKSSNPVDFISRNVLGNCLKPRQGSQPVPNSAIRDVLMDPGYKLIAKVFQSPTNSDNEDTILITDAFRAMFARNNKSIRGKFKLVNTSHGRYDWKVVVLTKEAYQVLQPLRAIFHSDTRALILIRQWELDNVKDQTLVFSGVLNEADSPKETNEAFYDCINQSLKDIGFESIEAKPDDMSSKRSITFIGKPRGDSPAQFLTPSTFPTNFKPSTGLVHQITVTWPEVCPNCLSESHIEEPRCPWETREFDGKTVYSPSKSRSDANDQTTKRDYTLKIIEVDDISEIADSMIS